MTRIGRFLLGPYVDRRAESREAEPWAETALWIRQLYVLGRDTAHLVYTGPPARIAFVTGDHPLVRRADPDALILLGWVQRCALVELQLGEDEPIPPGARFEELRPLSRCCRRTRRACWRTRGR